MDQKTKTSDMKEIWDQRWNGVESKKDLTLLGRFMFKAKKESVRKILKSIQVGSVCEVGCGLGYILEVFKEAGLNYSGIDISSRAVSFCKRKNLNVILKDVRQMSEKYDLISSDGMLEHFLNFEPYALALMKISRRYVLLIQPNHGSFFGKTCVYFSELFGSKENIFEYNYRIKDFVDIFQENGFVLKRNDPVFCDCYRLLLFEK